MIRESLKLDGLHKEKNRPRFKTATDLLIACEKQQFHVVAHAPGTEGSKTWYRGEFLDGASMWGGHIRAHAFFSMKEALSIIRRTKTAQEFPDNWTMTVRDARTKEIVWPSPLRPPGS